MNVFPFFKTKTAKIQRLHDYRTGVRQYHYVLKKALNRRTPDPALLVGVFGWLPPPKEDDDGFMFTRAAMTFARSSSEHFNKVVTTGTRRSWTRRSLVVRYCKRMFLR